MSRDDNDSAFGRMLENAMAAFLSSNLLSVFMKPLQHVANLHRANGECRMRLLYGFGGGPASAQAVWRRSSICLSQPASWFQLAGNRGMPYLS